MNFYSKRLHIRQIKIKDRLNYLQTVADDKVMRYISGKGLNPSQGEAKFQSILEENAKDPRFGGFALLTASEQFAGMAKFSKTAVDELEIGYLFAPQYWGQGLGTEIAQFLVKRAQEIGETPRLKAIIDPENIASRRILERLKFEVAEKFESKELPGLVLRRPLFL